MENETYDLGLDRIDYELSLRGAADRVGLGRPIAERGGAPIGIAELGGRNHAAQRSDLGIVRLEFIREAQRQSHDLAAVSGNDVLGHRADGDFVPAEDANGLFLIEEIAKPPRDRVDEHGVDGVRSVLAARQHLLQFWTLQRTRAFACVAIDAKNRPALTRAIVAHLDFLLIQRKPVFRLLVGRDADVKNDLVGACWSVFRGEASAAGHIGSYGVFKAFKLDFVRMKAGSPQIIAEAHL